MPTWASSFSALSLACVSNSRKLTFSAVRTSCGDEGSDAGPGMSRSWSILSMTPSHRKLVAKIEAAQNEAGPSALELLRMEFAGRALFYLVAQPQELLVALIGLCLHATLQVVHRRTADGAGYFPAAMHHGKQHHHPVMFEALMPPRSSVIGLVRFWLSPLAD